MNVLRSVRSSVIAVWCLSAFSLPAAELIRDSVLQAEIILPEKVSPVERYAADELVFHLKKITGVDFPVKTRPTAGKHSIRIGRAVRPAVEFREPNSGLV
ncbi:MAG: hypothetical protein IKO93_13470, partial [Lentisphaeria bacterium]|nr:hypothetical protein [Lentisphaeria bacterium]